MLSGRGSRYGHLVKYSATARWMMFAAAVATADGAGHWHRHVSGAYLHLIATDNVARLTAIGHYRCGSHRGRLQHPDSCCPADTAVGWRSRGSVHAALSQPLPTSFAYWRHAPVSSGDRLYD